ncbi:MAG: hypothetical protein D6692_07990 [Planctomycetota bacterium]|nr:MAG: hypothetical protein D6692_07990 [Planctomycetota bacterium]
MMYRVAFGMVLAVGSAAMAGPIYDVSGLESIDGDGSALNDFIDVPIFGHIHGVGWFLNVETYGGSWLSEINVRFTVADGTTMVLRPFEGMDFSGSMVLDSGGTIDTLGGPPFTDLIPSGDFLMRIELFESFVNAPGQVEARFLAGSHMYFDQWVPTPGVGAVLGVALVLGGKRRR